MPDPLTPTQEQELLADLHALEAQLAEGLRLSADSAAPVELDTAFGRVSRVDAMQQQSMAKANRARAKARLERVHAALTLAHEEEYGVCRSCDEDIGYARLKARPESAFCLHCQRSLELQRGRSG